MTLSFHCQVHGVTHQYSHYSSTEKIHGITHFNGRQNISHFFPRQVDFIRNGFLKIDLELIGHEISLSEKIIIILCYLLNQPITIFSLFLGRLSFFLLLFLGVGGLGFFCKKEGSDNYFLNCWELFSCYVKISAVAPTCKGSTHHLLADSVSQEAIHHYTRYSAFLR